MHLLRRFSREGPEKLAVHAAEPAVRAFLDKFLVVLQHRLLQQD